MDTRPSRRRARRPAIRDDEDDDHAEARAPLHSKRKRPSTEHQIQASAAAAAAAAADSDEAPGPSRKAKTRNKRRGAVKLEEEEEEEEEAEQDSDSGRVTTPALGHSEAPEAAEASPSRRSTSASYSPESESDHRRHTTNQKASPKRNMLATSAASPSASSSRAIDGPEHASSSSASTRHSAGAISAAGLNEKEQQEEQQEEEQEQENQDMQVTCAQGAPLTTNVEAMRLEIERLKKELTHKNQLIEKQSCTISHIYQECTCTICLELVWRPYILAPCGHVFCVHCLLSWFKRPLDHEHPPPRDLSDAERRNFEQERTLRRKKICPACRTQLACMPVEVWLLKAMLEKVEASGKYIESSDPANQLGDLQTARLRAEGLPAGNKVWEGVFDGRGPRRVLNDFDDGVVRCGECASEIFEGRCSNPACGIEYSDYDDSEFGSDHSAAFYGWRNGINLLDEDSLDGGEQDEQFSDSEMGDFIAPDDERYDSEGHLILDDEDEEDDDDMIPGPRRSRYNRGRDSSVELMEEGWDDDRHGDEGEGEGEDEDEDDSSVEYAGHRAPGETSRSEAGSAQSEGSGYETADPEFVRSARLRSRSRRQIVESDEDGDEGVGEDDGFPEDDDLASVDFNNYGSDEDE